MRQMSVKEQLKTSRKSLSQWALKQRLRNKDFTIISNNCWGYEVYKDLGLPYATPFVGLFLFAPCYLKLLKNLQGYLKEEFIFVDYSRYEVANQQRKQGIWNFYPIGILGGEIEIHFMHYSTPAEAKEKWDRRVKRIHWNPENLFLKFCDRSLDTEIYLREFDALNFPYKVCFTAKKHPDLKSSVWIKECSNEPWVVDGGSLYRVGRNYFDVIDWLNGGDGSVSTMQKLLNTLLY